MWRLHDATPVDAVNTAAADYIPHTPSVFVQSHTCWQFIPPAGSAGWDQMRYRVQPPHTVWAAAHQNRSQFGAV